jgi:type IV pilus assembly protein PilP
MKMRVSRRVVPLAMASMLAGCGLAGSGELQQWMDGVRKSTRPMVQPVPEPKQFTPLAYDGRGTVDPFDAQKVVMAVARQQQARASASAIKPDLDRRRETLEGFPLDQIRMVGMMQQTGANVALVESNGTTHLVLSLIHI